MSGTIVNLIIQLIAGAVGGNAAGGLLKNISLGPLGNTIAGAAGGGIGGSILSGLIPALGSAASAAGGFDIGVLAGQLAGGGITGAVVTAVVGLIKKCLDQKSLTEHANLCRFNARIEHAVWAIGLARAPRRRYKNSLSKLPPAKSSGGAAECSAAW